MSGEIDCACVGCGATFSARPTGGHRLVCGDSTTGVAVDAALAGAQPHLMVTDPLYGVSYDADWRNRAIMVKGEQRGEHGSRATGVVENDGQVDWSGAWALFPGAVAYVWHGGLHGAEVAASLAASRFRMRAQIVWVKTRPVISRGDYHWQHEPALHVVREGENDHWRFIPEHEISDYAVRTGSTGHWEGSRKQSTVWFIEHIKSETGHSTQKPVECMKRPIENNSAPGDAVYEPFSGSGTTIIAAEMTGRRCLAIELKPAYVDVGVLRWQNFTGQQAVLEASGRTFAETAASRSAPAKPARVRRLERRWRREASCRHRIAGGRRCRRQAERYGDDAGGVGARVAGLCARVGGAGCG
jgi:site-specific DNA-methyltransferase (adenine-specific)